VVDRKIRWQMCWPRQRWQRALPPQSCHPIPHWRPMPEVAEPAIKSHPGRPPGAIARRGQTQISFTTSLTIRSTISTHFSNIMAAKRAPLTPFSRLLSNNSHPVEQVITGK
jgi:hypothetical protein